MEGKDLPSQEVCPAYGSCLAQEVVWT